MRWRRWSILSAESLKLYAAFKLAVVYPFFLYANFSGYIDIVIALARLMRVRLPENFDRPFSASSFSTSGTGGTSRSPTWLKTYVYNPLLMALMRRISSIACSRSWASSASLSPSFLDRQSGTGAPRSSSSSACCRAEDVAINKLWQLGWRAAWAARATRRWPRILSIRLRPRPHLQLVCVHAFLVLGQLEADRYGLCLPLSRCATGSASGWLVWLCATLCWRSGNWLRSALLSIKTAEGPVLYQPLCARGLCDPLSVWLLSW
jgi:alginate O-acetyltransferase complex protein AlgI